MTKLFIGTTKPGAKLELIIFLAIKVSFDSMGSSLLDITFRTHQSWLLIMQHFDPIKMNYLTKKAFSQPVEEEDVAAAWKKRGYSCDLFIDPPGSEWNNFVHSTNELVTVVRGKLKMTIESSQLIAEPGDEIFIPKGANHSVKNIDHQVTEWLFGYD